MFESSSSIIVGLEIGTSKVCAIVGDLANDGTLRLVGVGQSVSRGVRKGEIVDTALAEEDVRRALVQAEQSADVEIRSVYLGVTGGHVRGFTNRGVHPVVSTDREISEEDVREVIKNAKVINLPAQNHVVHAIRQHFHVNGQHDVVNPVGMLGSRVEVDVHVIHGDLNRLQNAIRTVKDLQMEVDDIVFNGLASSLAVLSGEQKELGVLVIDIGGGTTEYVAFSEGIVKHTGVFALGGDHVSNDLAYGLKVPLHRAEEYKLAHGAALPDEETEQRIIEIKDNLGLPARLLNLDHLRRIMHFRLEEMFQMIAQDLDQIGAREYLRAGAVLAGGAAHIPRVCELASKVLQMPVTPARIVTMDGLRANMDMPEFATAIGLVKFGSLQQRRRAVKTSLTDGIRTAVGHWFKRG